MLTEINLFLLIQLLKKKEVCCFVFYTAHSSSSGSSHITVNHKSAQITAAADQVEQRQTLENTDTETQATRCMSSKVKKQLVLNGSTSSKPEKSQPRAA